VLRGKTWLEKQSGLTYASDYAAGKQLLAVRRHLKGFEKQFGEILGSFVPACGAVRKKSEQFVGQKQGQGLTEKSLRKQESPAPETRG
jgi:hypothetical protein